MINFILFTLGFSLVIFGLSCNILYINLLEYGYNFKEYIIYIIKNPEIYYIVIGFMLINLSILKRRNKYEKRIWYLVEF